MPSLKTKITTPLLAETRRFYEAVFGMAAIEQWDDADDRGVILGFVDGTREALLEIYHGPEHDLAGLSLQFRVDSVQDFVAWLPADLAFDGPTRRPWGATYVYLRDPNEIEVIVYEGGW